MHSSYNSTPIKGHSRIRECRNLEQRLSDALSNLRSHVHKKPDENSPSWTPNASNSSSSARSSSLQRTRELHKLLVASRMREGQLQDEVTSLKSTIQEQERRMAELERQVNDVKSRYFSVQHKSRISCTEFTSKIGELKAQLADEGSRYQNLVNEKSRDTEVQPSSGCAASPPTESVTRSSPIRMQRPYSAVSLPGLPEVSEYFKTTFAAPGRRDPPRLFRW